MLISQHVAGLDFKLVLDRIELNCYVWSVNVSKTDKQEYVVQHTTKLVTCN